MYIGVGGSIGSGKSMVYSEYLSYKGYKEVELAYPMKKFLADWYRQDISIFYDRDCKESNSFRFLVSEELVNAISKDVYDNENHLTDLKPFYKERFTFKSARELLQGVGTDILRLRDPGIHLWWSLRGLPVTGKEKYYFQALRFQNEIDFVKSYNGITIFLNRDSGLASIGKNHKSEKSVYGENFNFVLENNSSKEELFEKMDVLLGQVGYQIMQ